MWKGRLISLSSGAIMLSIISNTLGFFTSLAKTSYQTSWRKPLLSNRGFQLRAGSSDSTVNEGGGNFDFDLEIDRSDTMSMKWNRYKDQDVIPLWVADMDFASPRCIIEALKARVEHGVFGYTVPDRQLKQAICDYYERTHGWGGVSTDWVYFLPGLVQGLNLACRAMEDPKLGRKSDGPVEVLVPTPIYPPFLSAPDHAGQSTIQVPLVRAPVEGCNFEDWTFDWKALEQAVTPNTRLLLLCNPHNPVGRVFTRTELQRLADFCSRHDIIVCSDEIHSGLIFDSSATPHIPFASLGGEIADRTITLNAPSKTFNVPSLGVAYAIIPNKQLRFAYMRAGRGLVTQMPALGYTGLQAAYTSPRAEAWRRALVRYLDGNRELVYRAVAERMAPEVTVRPMAATYLAWLDVSALGLGDPWGYFNRWGVGLSSGADFGEAGRGCVRLNFGLPRRRLEEGLERMAAAVGARRRE
ncbi:unnamed protein product, partial [Heterosigma akashiwo]